jgi:hypothetical protein
LFVLLLSLLACDGELSGGVCTYTDTEGTCTFTEVTADSNVSFDFVADDFSVSESGTLVIGDGGTPPDQECIDTLGIAVDDALSCTLRTLSSGTCAPEEFEFDDIDPEDCE